jgi:hypothetical protein
MANLKIIKVKANTLKPGGAKGAENGGFGRAYRSGDEDGRSAAVPSRINIPTPG